MNTFPVVVLTGARQTGKSTLDQHGDLEARTYLTLDDLEIRDQAENAPEVLLRRGERITLDGKETYWAAERVLAAPWWRVI